MIISERTEVGIKDAFSNMLSPADSLNQLSAKVFKEDLTEYADEMIGTSISRVLKNTPYPGIKALPILDYIDKKTKAIVSKKLSANYSLVATVSYDGKTFDLTGSKLKFASEKDALSFALSILVSWYTLSI